MRALRRVVSRGRPAFPDGFPEYELNPRSRWGWDGKPVLEALADLLEREESGYELLLDAAADLLEWAKSIPREDPGAGQPCWENDWWGSVDALVQCAALRTRNPGIYVESGSGFSTPFA